MPQLDTSTWFMTIVSMLITLFILFQLKISKYIYPNSIEYKVLEKMKHTTPWDIKWTKIYSLLSLPLQ
nr:ATP synthase subunit 8 [Palawanosorex muscorum]